MIFIWVLLICALIQLAVMAWFCANFDIFWYSLSFSFWNSCCNMVLRRVNKFIFLPSFSRSSFFFQDAFKFILKTDCFLISFILPNMTARSLLDLFRNSLLTFSFTSGCLSVSAIIFIVFFSTNCSEVFLIGQFYSYSCLSFLFFLFFSLYVSWFLDCKSNSYISAVYSNC